MIELKTDDSGEVFGVRSTPKGVITGVTRSLHYSEFQDALAGNLEFDATGEAARFGYKLRPYQGSE